MVSRLPKVKSDGEVSDLSKTDSSLFKPAKEVLPAKAFAGLLEMNRRAGVRGPQKTPLKKPTTIRFDADVLDALKATGRGWQTRVNDAMRQWIKTHSG